MGKVGDGVGMASRFLVDSPSDVPASEKLRLAYQVFAALTGQGHHGEELSTARAILEECRGGPGVREKSQAATALGMEAFRQGDFGRAKILFTEAYRASLESGDTLQVASARVNLGGIELEEGALAESEDSNRLAVRCYEDLQHPERAAQARRNLAAVLQYSGRLGRPWTSVARARGARENRSWDDADSAVALEASVLIEAGLLRAAREVLDDTRARLEVLPQPVLEAIVLRDEGGFIA